MAGTTTYYGISYPTSTDYVKDGATAMQTIATGFDSAVAIPTYNNQTGTTYTFVLADAGKTVTSDNASAVTFTIPPQSSVAWAANTTLTVRNLGAGVVTIAGGAGVTVTNTAQTVAQYGEVKLIRTASNAWTVVPASGGASGLTLVKSQTIGTAVSSVTVTGAFSATYDNYRIIISGGTCSNSPATDVKMILGSTATGYGYGLYYLAYSGGAGTVNNSNTTAWDYAFVATTNGNTAAIDLITPYLAKNTFISRVGGSATALATFGGYLNDTNSYTEFTLTPVAGTLTGGTVKVYGYQN